MVWSAGTSNLSRKAARAIQQTPHTHFRSAAHSFVPIAACGRGIDADSAGTYDDMTAAASSLAFEKGSDLMPWFLT